jgi:hypothetical protein
LRNKVEEIAARAKNKTIFLCGVASNDAEMFDLFDKMVCLTIDEDTLRQRIRDRTDNDFGKAPDELHNILGWHKSAEEKYQLAGASMIKASKPLKDVVDDLEMKVARNGSV